MAEYYTCLYVMGACICGIMLFMVNANAMLSRRERRLYDYLYISLLIASTCDWLGTLLAGIASAGPLVTLLTLIEFSLAPTAAVSFGATTSAPGAERTRFAVKALAVHAAFELVSLPLGLVFYVDGAGVYHRGPLYTVYVLAYVLSAVYLILEAMRFSREYQYRQRIVPWLLLGLAGIALVTQMALSNACIIWLALSICSSMFYMFYCNVVQQTDGLTHLLNRASYEGCLSALNEPSAIVFFDVDEFKQVNDVLGHAMGDRSLHEIAMAISDVYSPYGSCYRIGGDEFAAVLVRGLDGLNRLRADFFADLSARREKCPGLPTVSVGYAMFDPLANDKSAACEQADAMMYRFKRDRKASHA